MSSTPPLQPSARPLPSPSPSLPAPAPRPLPSPSPRQVRLFGVVIGVGPLLALGLVVLALLVLPQWLQQNHKADSYFMVDLGVYRDAGRSVVSGRAVYDHLTAPPQNLPFTYPPTSALVAVPLAWVGMRTLGYLWTAAVYATLAGLVLIAFRPLLTRLGPSITGLAAPALIGVCAYLLPVRDVVRFGQVGIFLMALVVVDLLSRRTRWPRGLLTGLATAFKLTPGIFIPYLWFAGRRRAAVTAAVATAAIIGLTYLVAPGTSRAFWGPGGALWSSDRLGANDGTSNQSLRGMLLRWDWPGQQLLLVVAVALVGGYGLYRAAGASRAGDERAALAVVGLLAVLLSPVAWIHHLVWLVLVLGVIVEDGRSRLRWVLAGLLTALLVLRAPWWGQALVRRSDGFTGPARLLQDSLGLVSVLLVCRLPARRGGQEPGRAPLDVADRSGLAAAGPEPSRVGA